jgi:hypothetical protein
MEEDKKVEQNKDEIDEDFSGTDFASVEGDE